MNQPRFHYLADNQSGMSDIYLLILKSEFANKQITEDNKSIFKVVHVFSYYHVTII